MKNYKIVMKLKQVNDSDTFEILVKTVSAKSKTGALKEISEYENFERFNVISCELRK